MFAAITLLVAFSAIMTEARNIKRDDDDEITETVLEYSDGDLTHYETYDHTVDENDDQTGVSETAQPCLVNGIWYPSGNRTDDPCNRCWCFNGRQLCTLNMCYINGVAV